MLPLAAEHLSVEEWGALPGHGMADFDGDKIWLILGLIRERMTDDQRAAMMAHMPPPALEMWTGSASRRSRTYSSVVVRSSVQPRLSGPWWGPAVAAGQWPAAASDDRTPGDSVISDDGRGSPMPRRARRTRRPRRLRILGRTEADARPGR